MENTQCRFIFTLIGVTLPVVAHKADMNQTHIYNLHWPPHTKFHNGQNLSMRAASGRLPLLPGSPEAKLELGYFVRTAGDG
jgi:hypothetical protein